MKAKIRPMLMKNAILVLPEERSYIEPNQTMMVLSRSSSKQYSFAVIIDKIENDKAISIPMLQVNKHLIGVLSANDDVELIPYNIPEAETVTFSIRTDYSTITAGDWTAALKEFIINKIYDVGDVFKIPIDVADKILILRGFLLNSKPRSPIRIGDMTQIILEKQTESEQTTVKDSLETQKRQRVEILQESITQEQLAYFQDPDIYTRSITFDYTFKRVDPVLFDSTISSLFNGYDLIKEEQQGREHSKFTINRVYLYQKGKKHNILLDYRFMADKKHGKLLFTVKSRDQITLKHLSEQINSQISEVYMGLKGKMSKKAKIKYLQTFILEISHHLQSRGNFQLSFAKLVEKLQKSLPDWNFSVKFLRKILRKMDKNGLIADFSKIDSDYYMIQFQPSALTSDPVTILRYGETVSTSTLEELLAQFGWEPHRLEVALTFLEEKKLVKKQKSYREGIVYYFKSA